MKDLPCIAYGVCVVSGSGPAVKDLRTGIFPARNTRLIFLGDGSAPLNRTVLKQNTFYVGGKAQPSPASVPGVQES